MEIAEERWKPLGAAPQYSEHQVNQIPIYLPIILLAVVIAPEEVAFRGYLYGVIFATNAPECLTTIVSG